MTPAALSDLHAQAFTVPRPFTKAEFARFLATPSCFFCYAPQGFALGQVAADTAELLTLAVAPGARRQGIGRMLLDAYEAQARMMGASRSILDVAQTNLGALALYRQAKYSEVGRRPRYYRPSEGAPIDALVLVKPLNDPA